MIKFILLYLTLVGFCSSIPIDNGVEGEPEVECGATSITVNFNTEKPFQGHVYVKGLFDEEGCRNDEVGRMVAGITLPFDSCNVARTRSLNPRGIYVTTTVVISFHPLFVTKVDRAYKIQCFYQEADKTVSTQLEVSELTTSLDSLITQVVPLPICRYEILDGGPTGQPIDFAEIGQEVYHKWTCESETIDTFCMVVHSCYVDDGNGDTVQVLNSDGCALDKFLIDNLEYPTDLTAGQQTTIFKFADKTQLYYQCQITITIKEPHGECPRPQCSEPTPFGAIKSKDVQQKPYAQLRLLKRRSSGFENTLDVRSELSTMDISDRVNSSSYFNENCSSKASSTSCINVI
uniref:ZP domain-containing protein n=1 Tax=Syphacia muris TaxID=451379 RepID=A0A0N5AEM3_9BILA